MNSDTLALPTATNHWLAADGLPDNFATTCTTNANVPFGGVSTDIPNAVATATNVFSMSINLLYEGHPHQDAADDSLTSFQVEIRVWNNSQIDAEACIKLK